MTSKINLASRTKKAQAAARFVGQKDGKAQFVVPGSDGRQYTVTVRQSIDDGVLLFDCRDNKGAFCKGNGKGTVCYHVMAVILKVAKRNKKTVAFCANENDAEQRSRLGGEVRQFRTAYPRSGQIWAVVAGPEDQNKRERLNQARQAEQAWAEGQLPGGSPAASLAVEYWRSK